MIIDLDANATYAPCQRLQGVIAAAWGKIGNPSSLHRAGQRARAAIEEARSSVRELAGAGPNDTVVFTSGATEANNLMMHQARRSRRSVVSSTIEHPCILQPLQALKGEGIEVKLANPSVDGKIEASKVESLVDCDTGIVSIMAANNETGVINDIAQIGSAVRAIASNAIIHSDIAQLLGKMPFSFRESQLDAATISGHKFGALSGIGALILSKDVELQPLLLGGAQEGKLRGGTENVLGIIALGVVAAEVQSELQRRSDSMRCARDLFEETLLSALADAQINGASAARLPNTSSVCIPGVRADDLVVALDLDGILISSGAACSSGKPEPSHVLIAMGQSEDRVRSTIRVSFRADQTPELAAHAATRLAHVVARMGSVR